MADTTPPREIAEWLDDFLDDTLMETAAIASKIGEDALAISRDEHVYTAQTGNLQSSCGFTVTIDGIPLIMVAGMDYAGYVEDWGGDVLKSAEAHIRQEFDKLCRGEI